MLRNYSNILQLDTATLLNYIHRSDGLARALQFFFGVTLIAGIGILLGIPVELEKFILVDEINEAQAWNSDFTARVEPFLENSIPFI